MVLRLPKGASAQLPSRGMTMVEGKMNGVGFKKPLEPDGMGSHWLDVDSAMMKAAKAAVGDMVSVVMEPSKDWPEPEVPEDLKKALENSPKAMGLWKIITPMARWDWIRWVRSTKEPETRKKRLEVTCSKLKAGTRRPCCFNRTMCTLPEVSHSGVLIGAE